MKYCYTMFEYLLDVFSFIETLMKTSIALFAQERAVKHE